MVGQSGRWRYQAKGLNAETFQMRKGGIDTIYGRGAKGDFPWHTAAHTAVNLVVPKAKPCRQVRVGIGI